MVVAAVQANVLWLLNLLDACVRVLIGVARAVEVTPDKLARRYPEVHLLSTLRLCFGWGKSYRSCRFGTLAADLPLLHHCCNWVMLVMQPSPQKFS